MNVPAPDRELDYSVQLLADGLSLRYPEGFLTRGHAELALTSVKGGGRQVRGVVDLDRAFYLDDVAVGTLELLRNVFRRQRVEVAEADEALASTTLAVAVRGPGALRVRNNVADLRGDIDLQIRGTAARPSVIGRVDIQEGGKIVYADNEYKIDRGRITFDNPSRIDPVIDLAATTRVKNFDIALNLSGTVDRLDAKFSTDEGLADLDVLALLATGRELETTERLEVPGGAAGGLVPGGSSASTILANQVGSEVTRRLQTLFGFDRLRIDDRRTVRGERGGQSDHSKSPLHRSLLDSVPEVRREGRPREERWQPGLSVNRPSCDGGVTGRPCRPVILSRAKDPSGASLLKRPA